PPQFDAQGHPLPIQAFRSNIGCQEIDCYSVALVDALLNHCEPGCLVSRRHSSSNAHARAVRLGRSRSGTRLPLAFRGRSPSTSGEDRQRPERQPHRTCCVERFTCGVLLSPAVQHGQETDAQHRLATTPPNFTYFPPGPDLLVDWLTGCWPANRRSQLQPAKGESRFEDPTDLSRGGGQGQKGIGGRPRTTDNADCG
ncbi:hypothetical protein THAOC_35378, partial [Thalassiosira oceanica]